MDFIQILIMASQLLLGLSILVGVHEAGHMLAAKKFGMRVEKFSIGFPPKVVGFQKGETEYSIGAIPLGGFVKISGMVDESLDTQNLDKEPQPWEFRAKPAWQRLIVMLGGIIVNILVGILIYIGITWYYGEEYLSEKEVNKRGIVAYEAAKKIGLQTGDKIIAINGKPYEDFYLDTRKKVLLNSNSTYTILRDGKEMEIKIPNDLLNRLADKDNGMFIDAIAPYEIAKVEKGTPAEKAGLKEKDIIMQVNGKPTQYFHELQSALKENTNKSVVLTVRRNNQDLAISSKVDSAGHLGFNPKFLLNFSTKKYSLWQSIPRGTFLSFDVVADQVKAISKIFRRELSASNSFGSFLSIGKAYGGQWIWERFWRLTGMLSMILAFMNLLPIPALDGGHVMFLSYEMITRRKPSDKFLEGAQKVGMVILLTLMVFAIGNDVYRNIFK
jgi:regulator of sigma E protease